jgi:hypothetical protein
MLIEAIHLRSATALNNCQAWVDNELVDDSKQDIFQGLLYPYGHTRNCGNAILFLFLA